MHMCTLKFVFRWRITWTKMASKHFCSQPVNTFSFLLTNDCRMGRGREKTAKKNIRVVAKEKKNENNNTKAAMKVMAPYRSS